ncbi:Transposase and inactivated derivatives, IS5 family [Mucinivorans hirudinis]|uniref:Transposase and inactivated derivatives, IS5 family n=1 Tax=Mucinivorans hirudinis TaxID=1433126 RepID=A0A060R956_9BACT|nr:Transposase and inactivated derivatives, IS5 family [Mucinivorans hirudinis]
MGVEELLQLVRDTHNSKHPKRAKMARRAQRRLRTIAKTQLRELKRKMSEEQLEKYAEILNLCEMVVNQQKGDSNKIYSLHKPFTKCIAQIYG